MFLRHRSRLLIAVLAVVLPAGLKRAQAQMYFDNTQRILLLNRGVSDRNFQRYLYALPTLNQTQFRQQQLYREQMARQQALAEQRRIASTLNRGVGRAPYAYTPMAPTAPARPPVQGPAEPQVAPEILEVWNRFGVLLRQADPATIQQSAPAYRAGMEVVGVKTGGPAAEAGWKQGDVLLGLGKFRTETYDHVTYVAQTPEALRGDEITALILRGGSVYSSPVKPTANVLPNPQEAPAQ